VKRRNGGRSARAGQKIEKTRIIGGLIEHPLDCIPDLRVALREIPPTLFRRAVLELQIVILNSPPQLRAHRIDPFEQLV
jgi:hypothetical protein